MQPSQTWTRLGQDLLWAGAGVAEGVAEVFVLDVERGPGSTGVTRARDVKNIDGFVVAVGPFRQRHGCGSVGLEHLLGEVVELQVFPGYEDKRVGVRQLQQCLLEFRYLFESDLSIYRHAKTDCGWLDGCQGPDVGVGWLIRAVVDLHTRIRGVDVVRFAVAADEQGGQRERAVEALAG